MKIHMLRLVTDLYFNLGGGSSSLFDLFFTASSVYLAWIF
jgi:hypothetical protein